MGHFVAIPWGIPDPTSLVVVGAAATLGASCRAPLTAIALMVEITRWVQGWGWGWGAGHNTAIARMAEITRCARTCAHTG